MPKQPSPPVQEPASIVAHPAPRIVLGITGGIAAYKGAELTRQFKKAGVDVQVVLTQAGARFITPTTLQAVSGNAVFNDAWDSRIANHMPHIELSRGRDAIVIAPASADFLAKLAHGLADDLLSTLCLARQPSCRLIVAPAMNREMWEATATQRNVGTLRNDGVLFIGPEEGDQACGETGWGRMSEPHMVCARTLEWMGSSQKSTLTPTAAHQPLRVLITAGPTYEPIDPVRGITNRSSGKMGYAIADNLAQRGFAVTLVSGPTHLPPPHGVHFLPINTACELFDAVKRELTDVDLFFSVAAVADYTPAAPKAEKMKKSADRLRLDLVPTADVLAWAASQPDAPFCVGFAAESHNIADFAAKKRQKKKIPLIVANHAQSAIAADDNEVLLIDDAGTHPISRASKVDIAAKVVDHAIKLFEQSRSSPTKRKQDGAPTTRAKVR